MILRFASGNIRYTFKKEGLIVEHGDGRTQLFQIEDDWIYLARHIGWDIGMANPDCPEECMDVEDYETCPDCGIGRPEYFRSAYDWLQAHEGEWFEDPGYFDEYRDEELTGWKGGDPLPEMDDADQRRHRQRDNYRRWF